MISWAELARLHRFSRLRQLARRQPHADVAMAGGLLAVTLLTTALGPQPARAALGHGAVFAATLACGALLLRRRNPLAVLLVATTAAEVYLAALGGQQGAVILTVPLIAIYTVVESTDRRLALSIGAVAVLAMAGLHFVIKPSSWLGADNLALAALGALAVAVGDAARHRRAYLLEVEERARQAEREHLDAARRRISDERLRIARDLHDVVGHQLALINVHAGVADHVLADQPDQARESLSHIRQASRSALEELRDTIGLLRDPDAPDAPLEPTSSLASLAELLLALRRSGLDVHEELVGAVQPLPPAIDVTAFRVIQEALTNVRRHSGASRARLSLSYEPGWLRLLVEDGGGAPSGAAALPVGGGLCGTGHGLLGMRERVAALGGHVEAGPRPMGGFRVSAVLPLPEEGSERVQESVPTGGMT